MTILDSLVELVRRNPLTCLIIVILAIAAPAVLKGIAVFILYFILGIFLLIVVVMFLFRWKMIKLRKQMEEQMKNQGGFYNSYSRPQEEEPIEEGEIKVYKQRGAGEKRVNKEVGDYVEFEDVDNITKKKED